MTFWGQVVSKKSDPYLGGGPTTHPHTAQKTIVSSSVTNSGGDNSWRRIFVEAVSSVS